jgi:Peptidase family M23
VKRALTQTFFIILLTGYVGAQPVNLDHLLAVQRKCWSQAWVTSGFYDWRTVSSYRRKAGLHLGYDIAMPYGSPVASAWSGKVVAVTPWTSTEWGVTVRASEGWEVTYGHISPAVSTGTVVVSGTVIGTLASDHVDVKMRDHNGAYVAFAEQAPKKLPRPPSAVKSEFHRSCLKQRELEAEVMALRIQVSRQRGQLTAVKSKLERALDLSRKGLLSERELQALEDARQATSRDLEAPPERLAKLEKELEQVTSAIASLRAEAGTRSISLTSPAAKSKSEPDQDPLKSLLTRGLISDREWHESKIGDSLP